MSSVTRPSNVFKLRSARVSIDPSNHAPGEPHLTLADYGEVGDMVFVNEVVVVVQESDEPEEPDFVGSARIVRINERHNLLYLDVDWSSFGDDPSWTRCVNQMPFADSHNSSASADRDLALAYA